MTQREFQLGLRDLLDATLHEGPGPRAVVRIIAHDLFGYVCNEAGGLAPQAIGEVVDILQSSLRAVEAGMGKPADPYAEVSA